MRQELLLRPVMRFTLSHAVYVSAEKDMPEWWTGKDVVRVLDIGSNEGFFSLHCATMWPHARVVSVDGDDYWMGRHNLHIAELGATNNYACKTKLDEEKLEALMRAPAATFDLQFILRCVA